jgi:hypothetical protein
MLLNLVSTFLLLLLFSAVDAKKSPTRMKPNPLTKPSRFYIEDFPLLDVVEKTTIDPYLYLKQPKFGFPSHFQCLPVRIFFIFPFT